MEESKKSLKLFFIIIGLLEIMGGLAILLVPGFWYKMDRLLNLIIGVVLLYLGIKLYEYLRRAPQILLNVVIVTSGLRIIIALFTLNWISALVTLLMAWYLIWSIKRLADCRQR